MTADDRDEQAQEVEVVAMALWDTWHLGNQTHKAWEDAHPDQHALHREDAQALLEELAPFRAAERQEAAREALLAAAEAREAANDAGEPYARLHDAQWLRDRADGVTGREGE